MSGIGGSKAAGLLLWLPPLLWMGVIFRLSAIPGSNVPSRFSTLAHFGIYAVLGALLALPLSLGRPRGQAVALAVLWASLYGITDEFHQSFVPMRTPDVADWGMDTLGAFVGAFAITWLAEVVRHRLAERGRPQ